MRILRLLCSMFALALLAPVALAADKPFERRLRFTLTVENPTTRMLRDQRILLYAPVKETGVQRLEDIEVDVPHRLTTDGVGNSILELQFPEFPAYGTRVIRISAAVRTRDVPAKAKVRKSNPWLGAEKYIESDLPAVQQLAVRLKGAKDADTARAIYDWVSRNINYAGFVAPDLGAAYALRERSGDCTEYAYLATALARANGIPARVLGGYVTNVDAAPRSADYHNWAEFHVDGAWQLVDAQKGQFREHASDYVAMRLISNSAGNELAGNHRFLVQGELVARME